MANLHAIIKELRQERDRLDKAIAVLSSVDGIGRAKSQQRSMSTAARRRIAAAQRARWAKQRSAAAQNSSGTARSKRRISTAGIARIRAAAKARWAKVRAEKKK